MQTLKNTNQQQHIVSTDVIQAWIDHTHEAEKKLAETLNAFELLREKISGFRPGRFRKKQSVTKDYKHLITLINQLLSYQAINQHHALANSLETLAANLAAVAQGAEITEQTKYPMYESILNREREFKDIGSQLRQKTISLRKTIATSPEQLRRAA